MKKHERPTIEHFLDNIEYVVNLVGADYVGIGLDRSDWITKEGILSDFSYSPEAISLSTHETIFAEGIHEIDHFPDITRGLVKRGYSDQEISKIIGGNWVRLHRKVFRS